MVRTDWLVASVGVLIVVALAYSFLAPNVGYTIPAMTTENSFVVVAPWSSAPVVVQQACRPPPVGTIPVGDGVILVDQKGGQHFDFSGIETVTALDKSELGFEAILDVDVVTAAGDESVVVLEGPVPTEQAYASNTYTVLPDGTITLVSSEPTTPEEIQQSPPQQNVPTNFDPVNNVIIVTNPDGTTTLIPVDPLGLQNVIDYGAIRNLDGSVLVTAEGQVPAQQEYEARTYAIAADGTPTLVSAVPTTYEAIQAGIAFEPPVVVSDPATNTVYTYDALQDAVAALDVDTGQASMTPVADFPSLLGQSPAEFQASLETGLRVQDSVQYSAARIGSTEDVQIVGIVPPLQQVVFDIYTMSEQVDPSVLSSPVRTVTVPNTANFVYPYQIVVSGVAPVDRYTYVRPRVERVSAQTVAFSWQQTQTLPLNAVQQDPRAVLLAYASQTQVAQPLANSLVAAVSQQRPAGQSVIQPSTLVDARQETDALGRVYTPPLSTSPNTVSEASQQAQSCGPGQVCVNQ